MQKIDLLAENFQAIERAARKAENGVGSLTAQMDLFLSQTSKLYTPKIWQYANAILDYSVTHISQTISNKEKGLFVAVNHNRVQIRTKEDNVLVILLEDSSILFDLTYAKERVFYYLKAESEKEVNFDFKKGEYNFFLDLFDLLEAMHFLIMPENNE